MTSANANEKKEHLGWASRMSRGLIMTTGLNRQKEQYEWKQETVKLKEEGIVQRVG